MGLASDKVSGTHAHTRGKRRERSPAGLLWTYRRRLLREETTKYKTGTWTWKKRNTRKCRCRMKATEEEKQARRSGARDCSAWFRTAPTCWGRSGVGDATEVNWRGGERRAGEEKRIKQSRVMHSWVKTGNLSLHSSWALPLFPQRSRQIREAVYDWPYTARRHSCTVGCQEEPKDSVR